MFVEDPNPNASIKTRLYDLFPKHHQMIINGANSNNEDDEERATAAEDAIDCMSKMLRFSPDERLTVIEALEHPFLESMHNEEDEPNAKFHATFNFELEVIIALCMITKICVIVGSLDSVYSNLET